MNNLQFDMFCMENARKYSINSNDPSTKVGCVIVNSKNYKIGEGCNTILLSKFAEEKNGDWINTKYPYSIHAECMAILSVKNAADLKDATLYVTLCPCNECMKFIIQSGIKRVVYDSDKYADKDFTIAAKRLANECGIILEQLGGESNE